VGGSGDAVSCPKPVIAPLMFLSEKLSLKRDHSPAWTTSAFPGLVKSGEMSSGEMFKNRM